MQRQGVVHDVIITGTDEQTINFSPLGQVEVGVEDKLLVLVFGLELAGLVTGVGLEVINAFASNLMAPCAGVVHAT